MGVFHNGLCLVIKNGTYKYIDKEGHTKDYSWTNGNGGNGGNGGWGNGGNGEEEEGWGEEGWAPARNRQHADRIIEIMKTTPYGPRFANMAK